VVLVDPNELLAIINDGKRLKIITTKGTLTITLDEAQSIVDGNYPSGIKDSPLMENIPFKVVYKEIIRILKKTTKGDKEKQEKQAVAYKTHFTYDGHHYDEFLDPVDGKLKFIKYKDGTILGDVETVIIPDPDEPDKNVIVKPAPQIAQTKTDRIFEEDEFDFIKFPPRPIPYGTLKELYIRIKVFVHKYVEVKGEDEVLVTLWIMKAVLSDALRDTSFPFIHIIAPFGHGKSRLLLVMTEITPYGFYLINIGSAPLKRVSQLYSPILYVDEKANMDSDTAAIINAKFNKNSVVLNADNEVQRGINSIIGYKIFGPLALANRTPFKDDAIESKAFQISQDFQLTRKDVPRKIKGKKLDQFENEAREIRGQLLQFRIDYRDKINDIEGSGFIEKFEQHLEPRLYEILSFFEDLIEIIPGIKKEIFGLLKYQIQRNVEVAMETPNGIVASTFLSILENTDAENKITYVTAGQEYEGILLASIYDEIGVNYAKQTGKILQSLGIRTDRPRVSRKDKDGNEKIKRVTVARIPSEEKINELKARYDLKYIEDELLPHIEQDLKTLMDNEDDEDNQKGKAPSSGNNENGQKSEKAGTNQNGEAHVDNEDDEDAEKVTATFSDSNNKRKEGELKNDSPLRPLRPDSSQELGQNEKNNTWDYFEILVPFQYEFEKNGKIVKVNCKKGEIRKLSSKNAILHRTYVEKACPNGHYDPNSRVCISDEGGINNEQ